MDNENSAIKFKSPYLAILYYNTKNPARVKSINLLEPEGGSKHSYDPLDPRHPHRRWAAIAIAISATLKSFPKEQAWAYALRNIGDRQSQLSIEEISHSLGKSPKTIYRWLKQIEDELDEELVRRGIVEPDNYNENRSADNTDGANGTGAGSEEA